MCCLISRLYRDTLLLYHIRAVEQKNGIRKREILDNIIGGGLLFRRTDPGGVGTRMRSSPFPTSPSLPPSQTSPHLPRGAAPKKENTPPSVYLFSETFGAGKVRQYHEPKTGWTAKTGGKNRLSGFFYPLDSGLEMIRLLFQIVAQLLNR